MRLVVRTLGNILFGFDDLIPEALITVNYNPNVANAVEYGNPPFGN